MATHTNIVAEETPWVEELMGSRRVGYERVHTHHHHTNLQVVNFQSHEHVSGPSKESLCH